MGASRASIGLAFVAAMACTGVARAQVGDEIANGGFDTNLDGWEVVAIGASTASWNALGADGSPASGSLRTEMVYEGSSNNVRVYQCVTATAGEPYSFGAWIRRQAGGGGGHGWVRVFWYESSDCSGPEIDISDASGALPDDTWVLIQLLDEPAPDTTRSASLNLINLSQDDSAPTVVFFDDAFFAPEPGAASGSVAVLTALALLRRRRIGAARSR